MKKHQVEERFVDPVEPSEPREGSVQDLGTSSLVSYHFVYLSASKQAKSNIST